MSFFARRNPFFRITGARVCLNFLLVLPETSFPHSILNIFTQSFYLYIHVVIPITHIFNIFSVVYRVLLKIKQKQKNTGMYFTYDVIFTLKNFNIIRENSCKIGNMSENVIKFYRYVKYFSERFLEHITLTASLFIHYIFLYVYLLFRFFYFLPYHHLFQFFVHFSTYYKLTSLFY